MSWLNLHFCYSLLVSTLCIVEVDAQTAAGQPEQTNSIQAEMDAAIHQVEKIVNQPVAAYRRTAGMRVVALTSSTMKGDRERFLADGFDGYREKPIRVRDFPDQVRSHLA